MSDRSGHGESIAPRDQAVRRQIAWAGMGLTVVLALSSACAAMADSYWFADLAAHFPVQYASLALLALILLAWARRPFWAAAALAIVVINTVVAAQVLMASPVPVSLPGTREIPMRVAALNVFYRSRDYEPTLHFARSLDADVIVFCEVNDPWRDVLANLESEYPFTHHTRGWRTHGLTLLSRWPIVERRVLPLENAAEPAFAVTLDVRGRHVQVIGVHASWPMTPGAARTRNRQLVQLAGIVRERKTPIVVLGDLNVSPFSPHFEGLLRSSGLRSAATGFGWQPTWPAFLPPAGIQIDHILVTSDVAVRDFHRGPMLGSDHRPVVADLVLRGR